MYYPKRFWPQPSRDNNDNQRASINSDEAKLRTFPANSLGMASFFGAQQLHQMGENSKALTFGATGVPLIADLVVGQGHQHNTRASRLRWRQLATFPFVNSSISGDDIEDALCLRATANTKRAVVKLVIPQSDAYYVIPRFRVSVASAPSATITAQLTLKYYTMAGVLFLTAPSLNVNTARVIDREWVECPPVDLITAGASFDVNFPLMLVYSCFVELETTMSAITEFVYIHELSWGVYDL
jgi:hypothetical protein